MIDQEAARRKKLQDLRNIGEDPYSVTKVVCNDSIQNALSYKDKEDDELSKINSTIIGRVVSIRQPFVVIRDFWFDLQLYVGNKVVAFDYLDKYVDVGDFVWVKGSFFKTKTGFLTMRVEKMKVISKCLNPFPSQYYGIKDEKLKAKDRVARSFTDKDFFETMVLRSKMIFEIRKFFNNLGYLEIETPILETVYGGANAIPFVTYYEALKEQFFLRIATEIPLKKTAVAGFSKVYEIGKVFRNEGIDSTHNPEFTSLEAYTINLNLEDTMQLNEDLIRHLSNALIIRDIEWDTHILYIDKPFNKISMSELVKRRVNMDFYNDDITLEKAMEVAKFYDIDIAPYEQTVGHIFQKLFDELVAKTLIEPTFVYGFHKDVSPLAKEDPNNKNFVLRYELYIGGIEFSNGFSELNDPDEQYRRFEKQQEERKEGSKTAFGVDNSFIDALKYGLPPTGGFGVGIDRLIMMFSQNSYIKDVIFFPHSKSGDPEKNLNLDNNSSK